MHKVASFRLSQKVLIPVLRKEVDSPAAIDDMCGQPIEMGKIGSDWRQFSNFNCFFVFFVHLQHKIKMSRLMSTTLS